MEIRKIQIDDPGYPQVLREIPDAPKELYVRGNIASGSLPIVAVVGTRKPTPYGLQVTRQLVGKIAKHSVVVAGLAYGIDALAHEAAIENGGITWAVLGTGVDDASIYPASNRGLAKRILESGGALISEYPPGTTPERYHFPLRNRIIAGLSSKVVVVEAMGKSGALITGKLGLDYNREVLAVPGPITSPESEGTNRLIAEGATPVLSYGDIVPVNSEMVAVNLTGAEAIVYKAIVSSTGLVDEIAELTNIEPREVSAIITLLEMKGVVIDLGAGRFGVEKVRVTADLRSTRYTA